MSWIKKSNVLLLTALVLLSQFPKSSFSQTRSIDPELQKAIDDYIQNEYLPGSGISSLGLSIVQNDGELLYTTGYGMSDIERGIATQNNTQFLIASVTKSFTATVAVKFLHERFPDLGEGVLDAPVRQLFPDINFTLIDRFRSEHVTIRDMLSHRVCIFRGDISDFAGAFENAQELVYHQRYQEEDCQIRTDFVYHNHMYTYVGEIIAELANKPYTDAVQDLLDDLGMTESAFIKWDDDSSQMPNRAKAYYIQNGQPQLMNQDLFKRIIPDLPAGGLFVTPNDMVKYMRFRLNLGSLDGNQMVPEAVMQWHSKASNLFNFNAFKQSDNDLVLNQFGYGLGVFISTYDGYEYIQHGGDFPPYHSLLSLYPAKKLSIFSTINIGPAMIDRLILHATIFEIIRGTENVAEKTKKLAMQIEIEKSEQAKKVATEVEEFLNKYKYTKRQNDDLTGVYGAGGLGEVNVTQRFNQETNRTQYYAEYARWYTGWLEETDAENVFNFNIDTDAIEDDYAMGSPVGLSVVAFESDNLHILKVLGPISQLMGSFKLGTRLDNLPEIPWAPDSC